MSDSKDIDAELIKLRAEQEVLQKKIKDLEAKRPLPPPDLTCPTPSGNDLADIIAWCKGGSIVALTTGGTIAQVYHNCPSGGVAADKVRVIAVDVSPMPSLLDDGEWPWYIYGAGCKACTCTAWPKLGEMPHRHSFKLGTKR